MSLGQEFITEYMWPTAFDVATYATGADYDSGGRSPSKESSKYTMMLKVQTVTGAVVLTPKTIVGHGGAYSVLDTLPSFTPVDDTFYFFIIDLAKYDIGFDSSEQYSFFKMRLSLAGGTSIIMEGTFFNELLVRFPSPVWHTDGWDAITEDGAGNPRVIRIHEVL